MNQQTMPKRAETPIPGAPDFSNDPETAAKPQGLRPKRYVSARSRSRIVPDDDASAGHNHAGDATEQISLGRPLEVMDASTETTRSKRCGKGILESSRAQVRGG